MAQPIVYNWEYPLTLGVSPTYKANQMLVTPGQAVVLNQPLLLNEFADLSYGAYTTTTNIRYSNVQRLSVAATIGSATSFILTVTGRDGYGAVVSTTLTFSSDSTQTTADYFSSLVSIVCTSATGDMITALPTVTSIIAALPTTDNPTSFTRPFVCDVWNKQALYSFSITRVFGATGGNTLTVTPQYTIDPLPGWYQQGLSGEQPAYGPLWVSMTADNIPNSNPSPFVVPITAACSASFPSFPITGLRFLVNATNTASFTATILQQGGYY